jgi:tetratricopeptide (TPR) repeat protein
MGNARRSEGNFNVAVTDFENALLHLSNIEDRVTRGIVLSNAANLYTEMGELETARAFYEESIQIARELSDQVAENLRLGNLGWFYVLTGDFSKAFELLEKTIQVSKQLDNPLMHAIQVNNLGWSYYLQRSFARAQTLLQEALELVEKADSPRWRGVIKSNLGAVLMELGDLAISGEMLETALQDHRTMNDQENLIRTQIRKARWLLQQGQLDEAEAQAQEVETMARRMGFRRAQAENDHLRGDIQMQRGLPDAAKAYYAKAHRHYLVLHDPISKQLELSL